MGEGVRALGDPGSVTAAASYIPGSVPAAMADAGQPAVGWECSTQCRGAMNITAAHAHPAVCVASLGTMAFLELD